MATIQTKLTAKIIGRPEAAHIDTYEMKAGKPLGSGSAFVPKARDNGLKAVGVDVEKHKNNTVVKTLRDPVGAVKDLF